MRETNRYFLCIFSLWIGRVFSDSHDSGDFQNIYDYIIVGGGSAGCIIANRLSEDPGSTVLLLEAGSMDLNIPEIPFIETPILRNQLFSSPNVTWEYGTEPQKHVFQGTLTNSSVLLAGKILGGSSAINAAAYFRGSKADFDHWESLGVDGWSYEEVLPYFLKSEGTKIPEYKNSTYHNTAGPLTVTSAERTRLMDLVLQGAKELNFSLVDCNEAMPLGVCRDQRTVSNGKALTTSKVFIHNIIGRQNFKLLTKAFVTKILIDDRTKTATGVRFTYMGATKEVRVRKEVILSAGTFSSPKLLQLSGIGPKDLLNSLGIPVISDLPVGENLQDGLVLFATMYLDIPTLRLENLTDPAEIARYFFKGEGVYKEWSFATIIAKTNATAMSDMADSLLFFRDGTFENNAGFNLDAFTNGAKSSGRDGITVGIHPIHGKSRGVVRIQDKNPDTPPLADPKYFDDPFDFEEMYRGIQTAERLSNTSSFKAVNAQFEERVSECKDFEFRSYDYWKCHVSYRALSLSHSVGTCRMGRTSNPTTVVDSRLRVKDVKRLRVADASIMPEVTSGGTYATTLMIGEKAADMIKEDNSDGLNTDDNGTTCGANIIYISNTVDMYILTALVILHGH